MIQENDKAALNEFLTALGRKIDTTTSEGLNPIRDQLVTNRDQLQAYCEQLKPDDSQDMTGKTAQVVGRHVAHQALTQFQYPEILSVMPRSIM